LYLNNIKIYFYGEKLKIEEELIGKEIIDEYGNHIGSVKDVDCNLETRRVQYIITSEEGISAKLGLGKEKLIPIDLLDDVGDKVAIKGIFFKPEKNYYFKKNKMNTI
jgi:sporulation protein YlmC with PRC-barrel domain